ncbi:MAG: hypothetical protein GY769_04420 [bacterium]|nr:hypothetical protein [bacterium]
MAATELTVVDAPAGYEAVITSTPADPGFVAGDPTNGNSFRCTGKELLLVYNDSGDAYTITVASAPASRTARNGPITNASIPAGSVRAFQIFPRDGWEVGGLVTVTPEDDHLQLAVVRFPIQAQG